MSLLFSGTVQKGEGRGKALGFPTINIPLSDESLSGIYAAVVTVKGSEYNAAVYADVRRNLLEAHLLHFEDDLYGMEVSIELKKKIRDDHRFTDEHALKEQIKEDIAKAEEYFKGL